MNCTVKQLATLAGVSARTLRFYDQIGLLEPRIHGENGYRYYGEEALLRLQQILFFKELDLSLAEIRQIMDSPGFDVLAALQSHKRVLGQRVRRLGRLIETVDRTVAHLKGETEMSESDYYDGFSEEQEKQYRDEARQRWGAAQVDASHNRWSSYTRDQQAAIRASGDAITQGIRDHMAEGFDSPAVQKLIAAWHSHLGFFYECSFERLRGLGQLYVEDPRFAEMYRSKYHPEMPEFLRQAIDYYCDHNEPAAS